MLQSEVALARWVTQEGRGLVVVVNKMDLLKGKEQAELRNKVMKAVPEEVNTVLPQVVVQIIFYLITRFIPI
jgi:predicted GTPase